MRHQRAGTTSKELQNSSLKSEIPSHCHMLILLPSLIIFSTMSSLNKVVKVKVVSDVVCPFCFIGLRNLEKASAIAGVQVQLEWEPFMLNPNLKEEGEDLKEHLEKKYGARGVANFGDRNSHMYRAGRDVGINFTSDRNVYPTVKAHSLVEYVKTKDNDKANQIMEELYKRYFEKGENINSPQVLTAIATQFGIDTEEAQQAIADPELNSLVRQKDQAYKSRTGVSGVPYYIIERNSGGSRPIAFSGAQPADIIAEQLAEAAES
jgi:predicted DsbA family dithiol-disulfide isomerase